MSFAIPPHIGETIVVKKKSVFKKSYYVAKTLKSNLYAYSDGGFIETGSIEHAQRAESPGGLMYGFLGGHYRSYEVVKITERIERTEQVAKWPDPDTIFDR
jgi:hypothetical protein